MNITQFTMENVRCFSERQTLEIRPLIFLVGENSTGKTTALACFHVLANYLRSQGVDFNADPYSMGIFKDIVRNSRPKEKVFKLGFTYKHNNQDVKWIIEFFEKKGGFEPAVSAVKVKFSDGAIIFKIEAELELEAHLTAFDAKRNQYTVSCGSDIFTILFLDMSLDFLKGESDGKTALAKYLKTRGNTVSSGYQPWDIWDPISVFSTSPIRSRPKRTYDPTREFDDPEGSDIPMFLTRIKTTQKENWKALKAELVEFGKSYYRDFFLKESKRLLGFKD